MYDYLTQLAIEYQTYAASYARQARELFDRSGLERLTTRRALRIRELQRLAASSFNAVQRTLAERDALRAPTAAELEEASRLGVLRTHAADA